MARRASLPLLLCLSALLLLPPAAMAKPGKVSLSLTGGLFLPNQSAYRDVYSQASYPVTLRVGLKTSSLFSFYGGLRYLQAKGQAYPLESQDADESYRTYLVIWSPQLGVCLTPHLNKIRLLLGAGISYNFFREEWQDASFLESGKSLGIQLDAALAIPLARWLYLQGVSRFLAIPTENKSLLANTIQLGGLELALGLEFLL